MCERATWLAYILLFMHCGNYKLRFIIACMIDRIIMPDVKIKDTKIHVHAFFIKYIPLIDESEDSQWSLYIY